MRELKRYAHNPPHLLLDEQMYFITGSTLYGEPYLQNSDVKRQLLGIIDDFLARRAWKLDHWVILDTHYHFTAESKSGKDLGLIVGSIHRKSAKVIRASVERQIEKKIWHNYWDRCVRDEKEYFHCLNYMFWNSVKHNCVPEPLDYPWSSFYWMCKKGADITGWEFLAKPIGKLGFLPEGM